MPSPLGHGLDIVELDEFRPALEKGGLRFRNRLFTQAEQAYCDKHADPAPSYAARFAAKEAVAKALGTGIGAHASFHEIEIVKTETAQAPTLLLHGHAAETASALGISSWLISLTHTRRQAAASVIALG